jgi:hypothetical protein
VSTYGPEIVFDLPSGDERVQELLDAADCEYGETQRYRRSDDVDDDLRTALEAAIKPATHDRVSLSGFELHTIEHSAARVEITGSFGLQEPPSDFDAFATEGAT